MSSGPHGLRILHCLRAPVGGLFRHVRDLALAQQAAGHDVGLVADAGSGGKAADDILETLADTLRLGVLRVKMPRHAGPGDLAAARAIARHVAGLAPDVLHGHGAKGGAFARLVRAPGALRVYTPHGGSLHYTRRSPLGLAYLEAERLLARRTDLLLFESAYGRDTFAARVGPTGALARVVHNGVADAEFEPVRAVPDAADFVFVGELRKLKGVDELLAALAELAARGRSARAVIAGAGADGAHFACEADRLGVAGSVTFPGAGPARELFARGRCLVMPSRAESLPYVVLEAAAAALPMVATRVGGIPEIFGPDAARLVPPRDPQALAARMAAFLDDPAGAAADAYALRERIRTHFTLQAMSAGVEAAYREALSRRTGGSN